MPDLGEQLSAILQNPEAQQNIRTLLSSLQQGDNPQNQSPPSPPQQNEMPFDLSALFGGSPSPPPVNNSFSSGPGFDIGMLMKLQQVFSKMSYEDNNISLLKALRPYLKEPRKVDDAIHILQLLSILPALGEIGIFGGG